MVRQASALTPAPDPNLGALLAGRYRLLAALGEGGTGTVYDAMDERVERPVAVKLLHEHLARRPSHLARFEREALAAGRIGSEHIVAVTDFGQDERGRAFLVMERLKGRDVASAVEEEGPFEVARALHVALQCCHALGAAHACRILHRDVKPSNVLLVDRGDDASFVKLLDFGAAKFRDGGGRDAMTLLTRTGEVIGTPVSMAPEQLDGLELDERADLYALGVVLFYMLAGAYPYEAEDRSRLARMIREAPVPSLRARRDDVPEALDALVSRLLAKDRDARPATAGDVGRELAQIAGVAWSSPPARRSRRPWLALAAAGLVVGAAGAVVLAWPSERSADVVVRHAPPPAPPAPAAPPEPRPSAEERPSAAPAPAVAPAASPPVDPPSAIGEPATRARPARRTRRPSPAPPAEPQPRPTRTARDPLRSFELPSGAE